MSSKRATSKFGHTDATIGRDESEPGLIAEVAVIKDIISGACRRDTRETATRTLDRVPRERWYAQSYGAP